jgi:hypothetical protein
MIDHLIRALQTRGELRLTVKVRPSAHRNQIKKLGEDGVLRVDIAAKPENNQANMELIDFIAESFGIPRSNILFLSGQTGRLKVLQLKKIE